jgi:putative spermidine/putrescine transport system permease protein
LFSLYWPDWLSEKNLKGANIIFYTAVASWIMPLHHRLLGIGLENRLLDNAIKWILAAMNMTETLESCRHLFRTLHIGLGVPVSWTLPFGLLVMFAVFNRFNPAYEEAARDLRATPWQDFSIRRTSIDFLLGDWRGWGMLGFTLSWDGIARTSQAIGDVNTLPLELQGLTTHRNGPLDLCTRDRNISDIPGGHGLRNACCQMVQ